MKKHILFFVVAAFFVSSYAIGAPLTGKVTGSAHSIKDYPFEVSVLNGNTNRSIDLTLALNTNQKSGEIILRIAKEAGDELCVRVYNYIGQVLIYGMVESGETHIAFADYTDGPYYVRIYDGRSEVKAFKIAKK